MSAAESEVPAGCSSAGSGGSPSSSKIDEWRRYFRDRGLSAGDIPKALVVHEVLRRHPFLTAAPGSARRAPPCARPGPLSTIAASAQAIGLAWFASSWAVCYAAQPCRALGSRLFTAHSEQFFDAAQRCVRSRGRRTGCAHIECAMLHCRCAIFCFVVVPKLPGRRVISTYAPRMGVCGVSWCVPTRTCSGSWMRGPCT
jgi:hypothetical protein